MLTPSQFGALPHINLTAAAVHAAIKTRRITPKPKVKVINGRRYHQIDPKATMAPPRKPGPKGPRKDK